MTEDLGAWLKAEWDKHEDWNHLGDLVGSRLAGAFQAGVKAYKKESGVKALKNLLEVLTE